MVNHWIVGSFSPWKPPTRQVNSWDVPDNETWSLGDRDNTLRNYRIITFIFIQDNKIKPRVNSHIYQLIRSLSTLFLLPDSTWTVPNKTAPCLSRISISTAVSNSWRLTWTWLLWSYCHNNWYFCSYLSTHPGIKVIPVASPAAKVRIFDSGYV